MSGIQGLIYQFLSVKIWTCDPQTYNICEINTIRVLIAIIESVNGVDC